MGHLSWKGVVLLVELRKTSTTTIGVGAGKFVGCERFFPNLPKLASKLFGQFFV